MLVRLLSGVWTWSCTFDKWGRSCYAVKRWLDSGRSLLNVKWEEKIHMFPVSEMMNYRFFLRRAKSEIVDFPSVKCHVVTVNLENSCVVTQKLMSSTADASGSDRRGGKACGEQQLLFLHQSSRWPVSARKIQWQVLRLQLWTAGQSVRLWREVWKGNLRMTDAKGSPPKKMYCHLCFRFSQIMNISGYTWT